MQHELVAAKPPHRQRHTPPQISLKKLKISSVDIQSFGGRLDRVHPGVPEGVAGGNLVTGSQPASCNVNSRSFCHPTSGLSCLARQPISAAPSSQRQQSSSLCRPDATTNGTAPWEGAQVYEVSLCVSLSGRHTLLKRSTQQQPVSQSASQPASPSPDPGPSGHPDYSLPSRNQREWDS